MTTTRPQFWPKPITFDRSLFSVLCMYDSGLESVTTLDETREGVIEDIAKGQYERVVAVHEYNVVEGWSRDITADIAEAVIQFNAKRAA